MFTTHQISAEGTRNGSRPFTEAQLAFPGGGGREIPKSGPTVPLEQTDDACADVPGTE